jgi:hypothetical protein
MVTLVAKVAMVVHVATVVQVATVAPPSRNAGTLLSCHNSVHTAKKKHFAITKINWLTLFEEIIAVYSENHTKYKNVQT